MTERTAYVVVKNSTTTKLLSVGVAHKYSDNYKESKIWTSLDIDAVSDGLQVNYNTGFLTTGQDWWLVSWIDTNGGAWVTDPQNFRDVIDSLESAAKTVLEALEPIVAVGSAITGQEEVDLAYNAVKTVVDLSTNDESTAGFKSFILRSDDDGQTITIEIKGSPGNYTVKYSAPSGDDDDNPTKKLEA
jgi:hypothetical protein